jgi:hypothetical protein
LLLVHWGGSGLEAQVSLGLGGAFQSFSSGGWGGHLLSGPALDLSVRASKASNLILRLQPLRHFVEDEIDAIHLTSLEIGGQFVTGRERPVQLGLGLGGGGYALNLFDSKSSGASLFALARLTAFPARQLGVFLQMEGRTLTGNPGGSAVGLTVGLSFGGNH